HRVLGQEAYTGKLILQKTYMKKEKGRSVLNKGEKAKYIVENAHESIISQEMFYKAQEKNKRNLHNKKGEKND
ncbi:recombinase family protein, partial [Streptococcus danieliae]|nr:recombinase family protein [Streptococcus danieliae]